MHTGKLCVTDEEIELMEGGYCVKRSEEVSEKEQFEGGKMKD